MHIHSKKSRRRMHAIPAAFMLLLTVMLWLAMGRPVVYADTLLSAAALNEWRQSCNRCLIEPQFDALAGEIIRLESRQRLQLSRAVPALPDSPQLNWKWTADASVDGGVLLRLTLQVDQTREWPARTLHYVWDTQAAENEHRALSDFEHILVVSGHEQSAGSWHTISRDLNADWQRLYAEDIPAVRRLELAIGLPGQEAVAAGFVQNISISPAAPVAQPAPAIAITE